MLLKFYKHQNSTILCSRIEIDYCKEAVDQTCDVKTGNSRSPLKIHAAASDTGLDRLSLFEEI